MFIESQKAKQIIVCVLLGFIFFITSGHFIYFILMMIVLVGILTFSYFMERHLYSKNMNYFKSYMDTVQKHDNLLDWGMRATIKREGYMSKRYKYYVDIKEDLMAAGLYHPVYKAEVFRHVNRNDDLDWDLITNYKKEMKE